MNWRTAASLVSVRKTLRFKRATPSPKDGIMSHLSQACCVTAIGCSFSNCTLEGTAGLQIKKNLHTETRTIEAHAFSSN